VTNNIAGELPARMTCLCCFKLDAFEKRMSKRGGVYYVCPFCSLRLFVNNHVQAFGLLFWSKTLSDDALLSAARANLDAAIARQPQPIRTPPVTAPSTQSAAPAASIISLSPEMVK